MYGAATGSFAVEAFSVDRFRTLSLAELEDRVGTLETTIERGSRLAAAPQ